MEPLSVERDVVQNGVRLDCVFEGYEYRPEREEVRNQRLAGVECPEIAEKTGLPLEQVISYCRELGLPESGNCHLMPPKITPDRRCPVCGRIAAQKGVGGLRRFCSEECKKEYFNRYLIRISPWPVLVTGREEIERGSDYFQIAKEDLEKDKQKAMENNEKAPVEKLAADLDDFAFDFDFYHYKGDFSCIGVDFMVS